MIEGKCIQWMCYDIPTPRDKKAWRQCISLLTGSVASHTYIWRYTCEQFILSNTFTCAREKAPKKVIIYTKSKVFYTMYAEYLDKTQTKTKYKQENGHVKHILMIGNRYRMCRNPSQVKSFVYCVLLLTLE